MAGRVQGKRGKRGFRRIVYLLISLVLVPTALLLVLGIMLVVFRQATELNLLFGILIVALVACLVTGAVLALVFLYQEARLSRLQTDFVSKVSHELRTPLTSIRMFAEMMEADPDPENVRVCLEVLQKETGRLSDRIERLLDWGRMEAGRRVYELSPRSVQAVLEALIRAFETATVGQGVDIAVTVEENLPDLAVDEDAMVDAMVNLLANAWKYSDEPRQIEVRAASEAKHVRISVRDNGRGIPREEHRQIFQKFYRVNDLLSRDVEGSGLGLSIVRHVATAHRGRVEVESAPGKGSTFSLMLPVDKRRFSTSRDSSRPNAIEDAVAQS